jgi:hypothetical protein
MIDIKLKMGAMRAPAEMDFNVRPPDWRNHDAATWTVRRNGLTF